MAEFEEIRARRVVVGDERDGGPVVIIEATAGRATVAVRAGRVIAELSASLDETEGYTALSLTAAGDVVGVLAAAQPHDPGAMPACRLTFDTPSGGGPWRVFDIDGTRQKAVANDQMGCYK